MEYSRVFAQVKRASATVGVAVASLLTQSCIEEDTDSLVPAQSDDELIADALTATYAPHAARATVLDWDNNVLQQGDNGFTCMPTPPLFAEQGETSPICMDAVWLAWVEALQNDTPFSTDKLGIAYALAGGGSSNNLGSNNTQDSNIREGAHLLLIAPDPALLAEIPVDSTYGGPYVRWPGTAFAHVIVPVEIPDQSQVTDPLGDALSAIDPGMQPRASVMDWENNPLKAGDNGFMCMPTMPHVPEGRAPMCMDGQFMAWGHALQNASEFSPTLLGISYMLAGDQGSSNTDPFALAPSHDNQWVVEGPHMMFVAPDPSLQAITTDPNLGGPYVMWADTPYAHVMVPVAGRANTPSSPYNRRPR